MEKTFYITTPIYYASGNIHIGHTYCTVLADTFARYKRMRGYKVRYLTGSDEHGQKIAQRANKMNLTPKEYVDKISASFKEVWKAMDISYDYYVRTTDKQHEECVKKVFTRLLNQGDIYLGEYKGWYCSECESFFKEEQVGEEHLCPDCHREVHYESEKAYFLNVKKYIPQLLKFYKDHPEFAAEDKINEMINTFIEKGMEDLCITRTSLKWGIPTDEDNQHVIYVWIDALLNYISSLGYLSDDESLMDVFWNKDTEIVQLIGRDITRFHVIYWPILLMALGLREPDRVMVTGLLLTKSGVKLSKSLGNAPSPYPLIERYSVDSLRYYLAREIQFGSDGNFTPLQFIDRLNADLANNYGNLLNRTLSMINKYFQGNIPALKKPFNSQFTEKLFIDSDNKIKRYESLFDDFKVTEALAVAMEMIDLANKYFDDIAPWNLAKEGKEETLKEALAAAVEILRRGSIMLKPIMPTKTEEAFLQADIKPEYQRYETIFDIPYIENGHVGELKALFPRLKKDDEIPFLVSLIDN